VSFLEVALRNARRGFRVHPLRGKDAFLKDWPNVATGDETQIRAWAAKFPDYNVGIAAGHPDANASVVVAIVDSDRVSRLRELASEHAAEWFDTYSVTSGRHDRAHFYYLMTNEVRDYGNKKWAEPGIEGNVFELKVLGGQVVAEGSIHPITGNVYRIIQDRPLIPFPAGLLAFMRECRSKDDGPRERVPREKICEGGRHDALVREAGAIQAVTEMDRDLLGAHLQNFNEQWCDPPLSESEVEQIALSCNWTPNLQPPRATVGGKQELSKESLFHSKEELLHAPPISFLIEGFLQRDGATAVAGPVGQRKTLIALNIAHALVTGEPLFDHFKVVKKPARVIYLCPEVSLSPFADRLKRIGLAEYVGTSFLFRTLSAAGTLKLGDPALAEYLPGSVVILDTAIRFLQGDENSSTEMRVFAEDVFSLLRKGADAVVLLHHSPKGVDKANGMTLDNCMRGSGELAAFLTACWGTVLQSPDKPYGSPSYLKNCKQRDFESAPFDVTSGPDCRLHFVGDGSEPARLSSRTNPANKDGKEEEALQFMRDHPELSIRKMAKALKTAGITRGETWVREKRAEINGTGVRCSAPRAVV